MPRHVLVLLAAYNGLEWISKQVESILNQKGVSVTLLISVDTSEDGTERWVTNLAGSDARVKYLPHGGRFGGAAKNFFRLVKDSPSENFHYFAFADQDDIWLPDKLFEAVELLGSEGADGYSGNVTAFWPDGRETIIVKSQPQVPFDHLFESAGPGCTFVFSRKLFVSFQSHVSLNFSEIQNVSLHDWYAYAFSRAHGYKWVIDSRSFMRYRQHSNNQFGANEGWGAFKTRLGKVTNGWWLNQSALISRLVGLEDDKFVRGWIDLNRRGILQLAFSGHKCRRRPRDKLVFSLLCILLATIKRKS